MVPSTKQLWDFWISPKTISVKNTSLDFRSLTKCYIMCIYRDINWGEVKGHSLKQHVSKINRLLVLLTIRKWLNINRLVSDITEQIIEDPLINMWRYKKTNPVGIKGHYVVSMLEQIISNLSLQPDASVCAWLIQKHHLCKSFTSNTYNSTRLFGLRNTHNTSLW